MHDSNEISYAKTIRVDNEQEITINFMDITSITKKGVLETDESIPYFNTSVSFTRKSSVSIPMTVEDYDDFLNKYYVFLDHLMKHPETQQLRSINATISKEVADVIKGSVDKYLEVENKVTENINSIQNAFEQSLTEHAKDFIQTAQQTQESIDSKLKQLEEAHKKLERVNNLVEDFLVSETDEMEQTNSNE